MLTGYSPTLILLLICLSPLNAQQSSLSSWTILPSSSYLNIDGTPPTQGSPRACYANCLNCQIATNACEDCYSPYFNKVQGNCIFLQNEYIRESSANEILTGGAFIVTTQSWKNYQVVQCSTQRSNNNYFTGQMMAIQPVDSNLLLQYDRTLSLHHYLVVRFELIATGWAPGSFAAFNIYNQVGGILTPEQRLNYLSNVPKQSLCAPGVTDQRFSVGVQIQDRNSTSIRVTLQSFGGTLSVVTWAVITGKCHVSCGTCQYSNQPTACLSCNYFLTQIFDKSCSQCPASFRLVSIPALTYCQKCPIQYQNCIIGQELCYYAGLNATVQNNCSMAYANSFYAQSYELNQQIFAGSLWTVGGRPSPSQYVAIGTQQLSSYTYIGQAGPSQPISRIYANLRSHIALSISFNIFVVDVAYSFKNTKFSIYLNGQLSDVKFLNLIAMSNIGGGNLPQSFITFPPTSFYTHNSTDLNLTITADTFWGMRDLRIVYQVCDNNCMNCGVNGCLECVGMLQLAGGKCSGCPLGYGFNTSAPLTNACVFCGLNCLSCEFSTGISLCLNCSAPFFAFKGNCIKRTNIGQTLTPILNGTNNPSLGACSLLLASSTGNASASPFTLSDTNITTTINIPQAHYNTIVEFNLIRIGQWQIGDKIEVYLNDLLILTKIYTNFGNRLCNNVNNNNQTDFLSFQSLSFTDTNTSLTVFIQVVTGTGLQRIFGVANLKVYPQGCQSCLSYPFTYKIDYNYDEALNVVVAFSRTYRSNDTAQFKEIFILRINNQTLPYEVAWTNKVIYHLKASPPQNTILASLSLECRYPQLVFTDITDPVNTPQPFFARLLQGNYTNSKTIDNTQAQTSLVRFTPVQDPNAINGIRTFFQILARVTIYLGLLMFLLGLQTIMTHMMHNLQKLWLHIFLAALTAPALLRQVLTGFRQIQNQNIAIKPMSWQSALPQQIYYQSKTFLYQYYTDVNFFRNIYNIAVIFIGLMAYLILWHIIAKKCITPRMANNSNIWRHIKVTFHRRPYFYFNSIIFYQYLTLVLACTLQFTDLSNATEQGSFGGISAAAAIVAFVLATIYPLMHFFWMRYRKTSMGRQLNVQYSNRYHQIFFRFVHRDIWAQGQISYAQKFYNLYRFGQLWWYCVVVTALAYSPVAQLFLLLITQALHMLVILYSNISRNIYYRMSKVFELALFVGLQIILLVCQVQKDTLTDRSYNTLGKVAIGLIFGLLLLSIIRVVYNLSMIVREYQYKDQHDKVHARQSEVIRRDQYYGDQEVVDVVVDSQRD